MEDASKNCVGDLIQCQVQQLQTFHLIAPIPSLVGFESTMKEDESIYCLKPLRGSSSSFNDTIISESFSSQI